MDSDKIKIFGSRVKVESLEAMAEIERAERDKMKRKVDNIIATGCNVFINRQLIYNYPEELLKQAGVTCIEHSDFDGTVSSAFDGEKNRCCAFIRFHLSRKARTVHEVFWFASAVEVLSHS